MIRFGPSGNSQSFYDQGNNSTAQAAKWLYERGLNAFEYSFGMGINLSDKKASEIGAEFKNYDIALSVHAPYYINLANDSAEMVEKSFSYLFRSAEKCRLMGGDRVIFHAASLGKRDRAEALKIVKERLIEFCGAAVERGFGDILFCPETMGKINQFGNLEEIIALCALHDMLVPTLDFGHLNARTLGGFKTRSDFEDAIRYLTENLPAHNTQSFHMHFTKIEYTKIGEIRHLTNADTVFGPDFPPLAEVLKNYNLTPRIISESDGTQAEDAVYMKEIYDSLC